VKVKKARRKKLQRRKNSPFVYIPTYKPPSGGFFNEC